MSETNSKAKYWVAVMYPESMIDDWEIKMGDVLGYPYAYCIHNRCLNADKTSRKEHVHIMLAFPNTTTYKHAKSVYDGLGVVNKIERCISVRNSYNYLIHDTDSSRKQGKVAYKPEERITGNNFDIGAYEQIGVVDKQKIIDDICDLIDSMGFCDFYELNQYVISNYDLEYKEVFRMNHNYFNNIVTGRYLHEKRKREKIIFDTETGEMIER